MTALPSWIPQETWDAWIEMRKKVRKPATDFACTLAVKELYALKAAGHDPVRCLEQSILKCWLAFYPPKSGEHNEQPAVSDYEKTNARNKADDAKALPKDVNAENARRVREAVHQMKQRTLQ